MWPAIIGAVGALGATALSAYAQNQANKSNQSQVNENNLWNRWAYGDNKEFQRDMAARQATFLEGSQLWQANFNRQERKETEDYNRQMWLMQQSYNSPLMQAERLRAAGINPAMVMDGNAAGAVGPVASSSPASVSPSGAPSAGTASIPTMQAANTEPLVRQGDIGNAINQFADALNKRETLVGQRLDNETRLAQNIATLEKTIQEKENLLENKNLTASERERLRVEIDSAKVQLDIFKHQRDRQGIVAEHEDLEFGSRMRAYDDAHRAADDTHKAMDLANKLESKFGERFKEAELDKFKVEYERARAEIGLLFSQKNLSDAQKQKVLADKAETLARTLGIKHDNQMFNMCKDMIYAEIKGEHESWRIEHGLEMAPGITTMRLYGNTLSSLWSTKPRLGARGFFGKNYSKF